MNGYLDQIALGDVGRFEEELLRTVRDKHAGLLDTIRKELALSADTEASLKEVVDAFAKAFA